MFVQNTQIVASVQFEPKILEVDKNIAMAQQLAFEAASKGARVVVLPELCISGYSLKDKREASQCAQQKNGYQTEALLQIARAYNCNIVFGYVELHEGKLYNSAAIIGPQGLIGNAQKHNLHGPENIWAESSEQVAPVVLTHAGRLGVLICRDIINNYRETYKFYKSEQKFYRNGAVDTIALLTNWGQSYAYPDSSWVELAEGLDTNVIVSNRVGIERDLEFKGGSCIVNRDKKIHTFGSSFTEACVVGGVVLL